MYSILSYGMLWRAAADGQTVFKSKKSIILELLHTAIQNHHVDNNMRYSHKVPGIDFQIHAA